MEGLLHDTANINHLENTIYILHHYTAGVILFGIREHIRRHSLSKVTLCVCVGGAGAVWGTDINIEKHL